MVKKEVTPKQTEKKEAELKLGFDRWRKLAATGLLSTGLLLSPFPGKAITLKDSRNPPMAYEQIYQENYPEGWKYVLEGDNHTLKGKNSSGLYDKAINYFSKKYKEDGKAESFYMLAYSTYLRAVDEGRYENAEIYLEKAIKLSKEGTQKFNLPMFVDLRLSAIYDIGQMYADAYEQFEISTHKEKAIKRLNEFISEYNKVKDSFSEQVQDEYEKLVNNSKDQLAKLQQ